MGEIESRKFGWVSCDHKGLREEEINFSAALVSPSKFSHGPWLSGIKSFRLSGPFGLLGTDIDVPPCLRPG